MSVLNKLASAQNRRDDVPNKELARELAAGRDLEGIREIGANLWHADPCIQGDCLKVLYEVGYLAPELIAEYAGDLLRLLASRNNRLVWGGMIGLSTVAALRADLLFQHLDEILGAMASGSVITRDSGVKVLAAIAASNDAYREAVFPHLLAHLSTCRPKDVPQHAESALPAVTAANQAAFVRVLEHRLTGLSGRPAARVHKVIREAAR